MAQQENQWDEVKFCCPICLDQLKDPVTTSCGHSFCMNCIKANWDRQRDMKMSYSCPQCRQAFNKRPKLVKNIVLADLVEDLKMTGLHAALDDHCYAGPEDVACDVCAGRKLKALKFCMVCLASYCEKHLQPHYGSAPFKKHKLVEPSTKLKENLSSSDEMMMLWHADQQCIRFSGFVKVTHKGHDTISATAESNLYQLSFQLSRKAAEMTARAPSPPRPSTSSIGVRPSDGLPDLPDLPQREARADFLRNSQEITMDPNTANTWLSLSKGNRKVILMKYQNYYASHPDRFTTYHQVLSQESLTECCYWEVEWRGDGIGVGVTYKSIRRKNWKMCGDERSWVLTTEKNMAHFSHSRATIDLPVRVSSRVGVFLNPSAGILSFYNVAETMTLLHRVQTTFTEPLHAGLVLFNTGDSAEFCKLK